MTIQKNKYKDIIDNINIGNSIAEKDFLLESARVETPVFLGVLNDKYDLVLGKKGAGKTAIFKLINGLSNFLLGTSDLVIISGVNSAGESIFSKYKDEFKDFKEEDFENFWKLYFLTLINNQFIKDTKFKEKLSINQSEIDKFKSECFKAGVPDVQGVLSKEQILAWLMTLFSPLKKIKNVKIPVGVSIPGQATIFTSPEFELRDSKAEQIKRKGVYINNISFALKELLKSSGFKIWIILDRLDEVFERYSSIEFNGLRGLLRAYKSFDIGDNTDYFRIKIFLRDDIMSFLTDNKIYKKYFKNKEIRALPAATHIFSKASSTLSWNEDEIQQLILNRLILNNMLLRDYLGLSAKYSGIEKSKMMESIKSELSNKSSRIEYWNKIFPKKIESSDSIKWIFTHLKDSNEVVTPRSAIDMLEGAIDFQKQKIRIDFEDSAEVFPVESIKEGLNVASKAKLEKDVYNEFPRDQGAIKKLGSLGKYKLSSKDLEKLYGPKWNNVVEDLKMIGVLKYIINSKEYSVAYLFRPALNINYKY